MTDKINDKQSIVQPIRQTHSLKSVLLGSTGTGKSSIVLQYMAKRFNVYNSTTVGASFNCRYIDSKCGKVKIELWDTAGQERFDSLMPLYYRNSKVVFIVYDITMYPTYLRGKKWVEQIREENDEQPLIVLLGNKNDLDDRYVSEQEVQKFAEDNDLIFYECSAKTGYNIDSIFDAVYNQAITKFCNNPQKNKTIRLEEDQSYIDRIWSCWGWLRQTNRSVPTPYTVQ